MIAIVAPGQGSQTPGMLSPWLELPGADETIGQMSELSGLDLRRLGTTADADEIKDTAITQPLVVSLSLLAWQALDDPQGDIVVAGHSVGELTAAAHGALGGRALHAPGWASPAPPPPTGPSTTTRATSG